MSIHGGLDKDPSRKNGMLNTKILIENPAEDKGVTEIMNRMVDELNEGKQTGRLLLMRIQNILLFDSRSPDYNEKKNGERAWVHTLLFPGMKF